MAPTVNPRAPAVPARKAAPMVPATASPTAMRYVRPANGSRSVFSTLREAYHLDQPGGDADDQEHKVQERRPEPLVEQVADRVPNERGGRQGKGQLRVLAVLDKEAAVVTWFVW